MKKTSIQQLVLKCVFCCPEVIHAPCNLSGYHVVWPFWLVAVSVCGRSGLWPFRSVATSVCGRSGLWPFRFVVVLTCYPQIYTIYVHTFLFIVSLKSGISLSKWFSRFHPAETSCCWYFYIEYTTRNMQLWVLISTVHLTNNMHVRI